MLIAAGLEMGRPPEKWNCSRPEIVSAIHRAYLEAGADVIETNTFGATPARLGSHGQGDLAGELNTHALRLAARALSESSDGKMMALSIGPSGKMLDPLGDAGEEDIAAEFAAQMQGIGGEDIPDLVLIETMIDIREALIALRVVQGATDVPVAVTMTYRHTPRGFFTLMGDEVSGTLERLAAAGADIVGANCSMDSSDMLDLARVLRRATSLPLLCQPNAGNPTVRDGLPVYEQSADEFGRHAVEILDIGINAVGGCCGTTPAFIRAAALRIHGNGQMGHVPHEAA